MEALSMHPATQWHYQTLANRAVEALKRNNFGALYAATSAEAAQAIKQMIPEGSTIGFGGSVTVQSLGIVPLLEAGNYTLVNPPGVEAKLGREERNALRRQATVADVFLTGTNSITLDGKLVNTDATGNRVAAMIWGPKKTILVAGANKIVHNLDEAMTRVTNIATPPNCKRLGYDTPCAVTGVCSDCRSPQRICNATVILHRQTFGTDLTVVIVGEELGF
jgi:L-lactate utilization protein LutB